MKAINSVIHLSGKLTLFFQVGYLDVSNTSKAPVLFPPYFKTQIHKLEYGPQNGNIDELALYALSEGNLLRYTVKDVKEGLLIYFCLYFYSQSCL